MRLEDQSKEELIKYITDSLRPEAQSLRGSLERYESAFGGVSEQVANGFLSVVKSYGTDKDQAATMMRRLASTISPEKKNNQEVTNTMTLTPEEQAQLAALQAKAGAATAAPAVPAQLPGTPPDWAAALMATVGELAAKVEGVNTSVTGQAEAAQQQRMDQLRREGLALGYKEGTPEWNMLWDIAATDTAAGDPAKAHELMTAMGKAPTVEAAAAGAAQVVAEGAEQTPEQILHGLVAANTAPTPAQQVAPVQQPVQAFPPQPAAGGVAPQAAAPAAAPDLTNKSARDAAARQYLSGMKGATDGVTPS